MAEVTDSDFHESTKRTGRGEFYCRGCNSTRLQSCLDLGNLPLANELWKTASQSLELYPLHLRICQDCTLGQVGEYVSSKRLFSDYRYLSSISSSFTKHAKNFVTSILEGGKVDKDDWVLEIASNDGYLLQHFLVNGIKVIGIEPATNVCERAQKLKIPTINDFFTESLALELLAKHGHPKMIIANNVLAHVPNIIDFLRGVFVLSDEDTLISIENPSMVNLLDANQFDTIYHEHFSYLTISSVSKITKSLGLYLSDFEILETHGGSIRYWLSKKEPSEAQEKKISAQVCLELQQGILNQEVWTNVSTKVNKLLSDFRNLLSDLAKEDSIVIGYGAAAKASTIINAANIPVKSIKVIVDQSNEKVGRFMPINGIPIVSPNSITNIRPTDIIIFPWNIAEEIVEVIESLTGNETRIWRLIPEIERLR